MNYNYKRHILFLIILFAPLIFYGQRFAIISDIHGANINTLEVSNLVKSKNPDFIITCGDNCYPSADSIDNQVGQYYCDYIHPYSGKYCTGGKINNLFFPTLGNHEYETGNIDEYLNFFTLPNNERYYDFIQGNVHFFAINSNFTEPDGYADTSIQGQWLKNKLATSTSLYKIVYFHYPPFTSGVHGSTLHMQWPFKQWGATAVFSGHDHNYERLLVDSFPYFVCGTGGGVLYTTYVPLAGSQIHYSQKHGAVFAEANSDSITFKFITVNDSLVDTYSIQKNQTNLNDKLVNSSEEYDLHLFPNPFRSNTFFQFTLKEPCLVQIKIIDVFGRETKVFADNMMSSGKHVIDWNTEKLKSGIYFYSFYINTHLIKVGKAIISN